MNTSNQNHDPTQSDDLPDRLVDLALSELIGGNTPPDLSSRIAAATFRQPAAVGQVPRTRQDRAFWVNLAIAVMLLIGVTIVLLPPVRSAREQSRPLVAKTTSVNTKSRRHVAKLPDQNRSASITGNVRKCRVKFAQPTASIN